jgi:hypothetical protein
MDSLDVCHVQDVDMNVLVGSRFHDLILCLLGTRRITADKVNDPTSLGNFKGSLKNILITITTINLIPNAHYN